MFLSKRRSSIIAIMLIAVFLLPAIPNTARGANPSTPTVFVTSKDYAGSTINDTTLTPGSTFSVQVNVTNAPSNWNGFEFALYYDQQYINVTSYDDTTLFPSPYTGPGNFNGPGALRLSVLDLGAVSISAGTLANILFTVKALGVSPLTLAAGMTQTGGSAGPPPGVCSVCPSQTPNWTRLLAGSQEIGVSTKDGYFTNQGSLGPVASFTYSPAVPAQGQTVTFNATTSSDPDNKNALNHGIQEYRWDFGTATNTGYESTFSSIITHVFSASGQNSSTVSGNFSVRLTIIDSDSSFQGMITHLVSISAPPSHCIQISAIFTKSQISLGTTENVRVQLTNSGTFSEHFNLTVGYSPQNVTFPPIMNSSLTPTKVQTYSFNINTTNLAPSVYLITARVTLYGNRTVPVIANCSAGTSTQPFQVTVSGAGTAALVILEAVIIFVAIVAAVALLLRRRRRPEPP